MKQIFYITALFLIQLNLFAQEGVVKSFYANGKIESEITYYNNIREGEAKFYYENGNLKEERFYVNGRVEGLVRLYNEDGKIKEMVNLENGKREGPSTLFDAEGKLLASVSYSAGIREVPEAITVETPVVTSGKGKTETEQIPVKEQGKKNDDKDMSLPPELVEFENVKSPEFYTIVEVMPEPVGGIEKIQKKIIYPKDAMERGIQGEVKVQVLINEYGDVDKADVIEGLGYGCDEIARIAVYYTKFKPGMQRGKPVKVQMTIPVEFKITNPPAQ
jgi:TonB family protein